MGAEGTPFAWQNESVFAEIYRLFMNGKFEAGRKHFTCDLIKCCYTKKQVTFKAQQPVVQKAIIIDTLSAIVHKSTLLSFQAALE